MIHEPRALALPFGLTLPSCVTLHITFNQHASYYEDIPECYERAGEGNDWVSDEEREKAIAGNSVWSVQWYPHTPVGFYRVLASSLEAALTAACAVDTSR